MHKKSRVQRKELMALRRQQFEIETGVEQMQLQRGVAADDVDQAKEDLDALKKLIREKLDALDKTFHPTWGQLFKAGFQESRFAQQVVRRLLLCACGVTCVWQIEDYACVYSSRASNLGLASPRRPYRPVRDKMPHDHYLEGL